MFLAFHFRFAEWINSMPTFHFEHFTPFSVMYLLPKLNEWKMSSMRVWVKNRQWHCSSHSQRTVTHINVQISNGLSRSWMQLLVGVLSLFSRMPQHHHWFGVKDYRNMSRGLLEPLHIYIYAWQQSHGRRRCGVLQPFDTGPTFVQIQDIQLLHNSVF